MNKQQIINELRKRGHGRLADNVDAEVADDAPVEADVSAAEFTAMLAEPKATRVTTAGVYVAPVSLDGSGPFEIVAAKKKAK